MQTNTTDGIKQETIMVRPIAIINKPNNFEFFLTKSLFSALIILVLYVFLKYMTHISFSIKKSGLLRTEIYFL